MASLKAASYPSGTPQLRRARLPQSSAPCGPRPIVVTWVQVVRLLGGMLEVHQAVGSARERSCLPVEWPVMVHLHGIGLSCRQMWM